MVQPKPNLEPMTVDEALEWYCSNPACMNCEHFRWDGGQEKRGTCEAMPPQYVGRPAEDCSSPGSLPSQWQFPVRESTDQACGQYRTRLGPINK